MPRWLESFLMQVPRMSSIICFLIVSPFLLPATGNAQPVRKTVASVSDFWHDSLLDKPFQYSPDDPWKRGVIFNMQTGNFGRYYNCDGEECKRYSPYICWKVHDEPDFLPIFNIRANLRNDISSVRQRIIDGTSGCFCNCGKPGCPKCARKTHAAQCQTCGKEGCQDCGQGTVNAIQVGPPSEAEGGSSKRDFTANESQNSAQNSVTPAGYLIASPENATVEENVQRPAVEGAIPLSTVSVISAEADSQCCSNNSCTKTNCDCKTCRRRRCNGGNCAPDPIWKSCRNRKCAALNCHDIDTSFDENSPAGLLTVYPDMGMVVPIPAPAVQPLIIDPQTNQSKPIQSQPVQSPATESKKTRIEPKQPAIQTQTTQTEGALPCNCLECRLKKVRKNLATWNEENKNRLESPNRTASEPRGFRLNRITAESLRR